MSSGHHHQRRPEIEKPKKPCELTEIPADILVKNCVWCPCEKKKILDSFFVDVNLRRNVIFTTDFGPEKTEVEHCHWGYCSVMLSFSNG